MLKYEHFYSEKQDDLVIIYLIMNLNEIGDFAFDTLIGLFYIVAKNLTLPGFLKK